ncbi:MAG: trigger factor [Anaerolineae bacterium]|nr:trigger factor [Anaerolineae bacterium]
MSKVETELLDNHQIKLVVEVEPELVQQEMQAAARRISKHVNIPGFRKGKVPYRVIAQHYGEEMIFEEAIETLGQSVYVEALKESEIEPYAPGSLDDVTRDPVVLTFTIPLIPEVELNDYREVRLPFETEEVTDEMVEETIEGWREQAATLDPVERAIQMGDVVMMDIVGTLVRDEEQENNEAEDDKENDEEMPSTWVNRKGVRVKIDEETTYPVPGFSEKVAGMEAGESRSFDMSFEEDDEEMPEALRGKTVHFEVTCDTVYVQNMPELNDEFAKDVDEDYEDLAAMRADVRSQLEKHAEDAARDRYVAEIFEHLLESVVEIKHPPVMVEDQIDHMMERYDQELRQQGLNLEEYLRIRNIDENQMREDLEEQAEQQVKQMLILGKLVEVEKLSIRDKDITEEIKNASLSFGAQAAVAQQILSTPESKRNISNRLIVDKAIDRLVLIAKGEAPEIGAEEPEEEPVEEEAPVDTVEAVEEPEIEAEASPEVEEPEVEAEEMPEEESTESEDDKNTDESLTDNPDQSEI